MFPWRVKRASKIKWMTKFESFPEEFQWRWRLEMKTERVPGGRHTPTMTVRGFDSSENHGERKVDLGVLLIPHPQKQKLPSFKKCVQPSFFSRTRLWGAWPSLWRLQSSPEGPWAARPVCRFSICKFYYCYHSPVPQKSSVGQVFITVYSL